MCSAQMYNIERFVILCYLYMMRNVCFLNVFAETYPQYIWCLTCYLTRQSEYQIETNLHNKFQWQVLLLVNYIIEYSIGIDKRNNNKFKLNVCRLQQTTKRQSWYNKTYVLVEHRIRFQINIHFWYQIGCMYFHL